MRFLSKPFAAFDQQCAFSRVARIIRKAAACTMRRRLAPRPSRLWKREKRGSHQAIKTPVCAALRCAECGLVSCATALIVIKATELIVITVLPLLPAAPFARGRARFHLLGVSQCIHWRSVPQNPRARLPEGAPCKGGRRCAPSP